MPLSAAACEALERLQALKAVVRELEATELAILLTGQPRSATLHEAAQLDIDAAARVTSNELLDLLAAA